jgi:PAS domain S-box-containing protein
MADPYAHQSKITLEQQITHLAQMTRQIEASLVQTIPHIPSKYTTDLVQLAANLQHLSQQVARAEDELKNLKALTDIAQIVNSSLELNELLRIVMDTIVRLTGAERGFLMLRNDQGELTMRIARNWEQESVAGSEQNISRTVVDRVVNEGQAIITTNAQEDPRFGGHESVIAYNLRSILCVPLQVKGDLTGVIYTDNRIRTGIFSDSERDLLTAFANQAAIALENARLFDSVRRTLAEVTELKNLMDNVFASIASGVITTDIAEKITLCNRAAENILGSKAPELVGQPLEAALPPIAAELTQYVHSVQAADEPILGVELNPVLPRRGLVSWSLNLSPLKDADRTTQGVAIVVDDLTEKKRLEGQRRLFERMVSPAVIDQLDPDKLHLGGKRAEITCLFADIRGFTQFSERFEPEELFNVLNRYLAAAADAVLEHEGTVDKFMGDAVMAWFNAPIPQPDHALRAVRTGLGIRASLVKLRRQLPPELHLAFGVGIHFGEALLGLVGTEKRLEYTAIGDSVNTAKRIQENSAANQILISETVYQMVKTRVEARRVDPLVAKGKREPLEVYEVLGMK